MISHKISIWACSLLFVFAGCTQDMVKPIENDKDAPGAVQDVKTESLPGAVKFTYTLPSDPDLLYVLAKYTNKNGKVLEFRASFYTNSLMVEGFGDTDTYRVELYTVDRSENRSEPQVMEVAPLTPPILSCYESLDMFSDFGGMTFEMDNKFNSDLAIYVCTPDELGDMVLAETFYTAREQITYSVRGYDAVPRRFGVFLQDKYGNETDTLFTELTPIYEKELDKTKFREMFLQNDSPVDSYDGKMEYVWNGRISKDGDSGGVGLHSGTGTKDGPAVFTFDMGVLAKLSRFALWPIQDEKHFYNDMSPRRYEVWGCATEPSPDGSWDNWIKLLDMENVKPSGSPIGILTDDDIEAAKLGDQANVPLDMPRVRYIRIKCLKNWSNNYNICFTELTFWGNDNEEESN